jgi:hypothetical protein
MDLGDTDVPGSLLPARDSGKFGSKKHPPPIPYDWGNSEYPIAGRIPVT